MKFRGVIYESLALKEFYNISCTLAKLSKDCVLRITATNLYFIMNDDSTGVIKPVVWCELIAPYYFKEYNMEGVSPECNEIYLEFSPVLLNKSLTFLKMCVKSLKIKLTSKSTPCLTVEIECAQGYQDQQCLHDIPVKVLSRRLWTEFSEPEDMNYHITIQMPQIKTLKNIIERLKSLSQYLIITASKDGRFSMSVQTTMGDIAVHAPNLDVIDFSGQISDDSQDITQLGSKIHCQVDIKRIHAYFMNQHMTCKKILCSIVHEQLVMIYFENDGVNLKFFLAQFTD